MKGERLKVARRISRAEMVKIAGEIAEFIVTGTQDNRLEWKSKTRRTFRVRLEGVFPSSMSRSTLVSRGKRFYGQLQGILIPLGWIRRGGGWWHRP